MLMVYQHPNKRTKVLPLTTSHIGHLCNLSLHCSCLHCQFLCRILKALFYQTSSEIKLFLQKKCKIFERWGLRPQTPRTAAPLRISGYLQLYNTYEFWGFVLKIFIIPPHQNFLDPPLPICSTDSLIQSYNTMPCFPIFIADSFTQTTLACSLHFQATVWFVLVVTDYSTLPNKLSL